ncbi:MAG: hypothetical protein LBN12_08685 [Clostridiales Family XIII bacterium]|jgi:hypothetical protein|nr:hypothetical protein [Clostridiales Family XIII bacterium]
MNYDKKTIRVFIVIAVLCAAALIFLYGMAPDFREKTDLAISENAMLERDIAEIETETKDPGKIDREIEELHANIDAYAEGRDVTAENIQEALNALCGDAGVTATGISPGEAGALLAAGTYAPALMRTTATIVFYGEEGAGYALMQAIENSADGDFEISSFAYQKDEETEQAGVGDWTITVALYYYEAASNA